VLLALAVGASAQDRAPDTVSASVAFHVVDVRVGTNSDWTVVQIGGDGSVLTSRVVGATPGTIEATSDGGRLTLRQSLADAGDGKYVGMTVRVALVSADAGGALKVVIEKGAIGATAVALAMPPDLVAGAKPPWGEVESKGTVAADTDRNRREFEVGVSVFRAEAPRRAEPRRADVPKMVWAFYYPWYGMKSWESTQLNDRPAERYASDDPAAIRRHIDEAKGSGVDGFICSWWGPGSMTDRAFKEILAAAGEKDFKVTIYFETLNEKGGRPEKEVLGWLGAFLKAYRDAPALMRVNGKPVLVLWASGSEGRGVWRRVFDGLHREGLDAEYIGMGYEPSLLELFDGLHEYGVFNIPDLGARQSEMGRATRYFGLLDDDPGPPKLWCATVQPGYDERPIPGRRGLFKDREAGAFYRSTWESAIASEPDWVFITTWNEWWEHTAIEPGEKEGDLYLKITKEYAERWKAGR
jgi:hypothetical protein